MTEAERIKREKWLPKKFWVEERIYDYNVSSDMKKVWAIELDLYREFARVCEENELSFFTDGGTTLGAVRHGGFIPWDDDLDVCMPRDSYEKLKNLAEEFEHPYFLQNVYTDPEFGYSFMRLRNENTTVVVEPFTQCRFSQGIYIDIFPIDQVLPENYVERRNQIHDLIMINSAYMRRDCLNKSERDFELIDKYKDKFDTPCSIFEKIEQLAMADIDKETSYVSLIVSTQYDAEKKIWRKEIFDDYAEKDFEGIKVRIPAGYDEQLRIYFGDYMKFPPVEKRGIWHNMRFYPDIPYRIFYKEKYGVDF